MLVSGGLFIHGLSQKMKWFDTYAPLVICIALAFIVPNWTEFKTTTHIPREIKVDVVDDSVVLKADMATQTYGSIKTLNQLTKRLDKQDFLIYRTWNVLGENIRNRIVITERKK